MGRGRRRTDRFDTQGPEARFYSPRPDSQVVIAQPLSGRPRWTTLHDESLLSKQRVICHYLLCLGIFLRPKVVMPRVCPKSAEPCLAQDAKRAICGVRHAERDCGIMVCVVQVAVN